MGYFTSVRGRGETELLKSINAFNAEIVTIYSNSTEPLQTDRLLVVYLIYNYEHSPLIMAYLMDAF